MMNSAARPDDRSDLDGLWNHNTAYFTDLLEAMPKRCRAALDIGCGDGLLARAMIDRTQSVTGIDSDHASISEARRLSADHDNIDVVEGDFLTAALDEESFDFISAVASLHHMAPDEALSKAKTLLRPGGTLFIVGCARSATPTDFAYDAIGTVANRVVTRRRGFWQHTAPVAEPDKTYRDMRNIAVNQLPNSTFQRRLYYRYTLTWTLPR